MAHRGAGVARNTLMDSVCPSWSTTAVSSSPRRPASPQLSDIDRVHLHFAFVPIPRPEQAKQTEQALLDHFVGATQQSDWEGDAERLGGLEIQKQFNFRGLLDW
jgi:hypothetical protein